MWIIGFLALGLVHASPRLDPLVYTDQGVIRGIAAENGDYSAFLGIPYAIINESNPFGASLPYPKYDTIFDANDGSKVCPQTDRFSSETKGTLDCLRLNIFVPNVANSRNRLPVLVWIHGGAFEGGAGIEFGPKFLVQHDVILVTINYRLGPYGFMCLDTPEVPGNQGLKDQYTAVEWVKENIAEFGGNANRITIFGQSAGSMSTDFHLLSKRPKIFHQAIMQSGSALCPEEVVSSDITKPIKIAVQLGFETENMEDALAFLTSSDEHLVIAASNALSLKYRPCVEKSFDDIVPFVSEYPEHAVPDIKIPILVGYNSHEERRAGTLDYDQQLNLFKSTLAPVFDFGEDINKMANIIRHFYIGDEDINADLIWNLIDFASDFKFAHPTQRALERYFENGARDIFHYVFHYVGDKNAMTDNFSETKVGAFHADELHYLFDSNPSEEPSIEDQLIIDRMTTMWTNFAKTGNPTPEITELLPVKWAKVEDGIFNYLRIDSDLTISNRPYHDRLAFWDLFYILNRSKLIVNSNQDS